jgi:transcription elongation factor Elf1
LTNGPLQLIAQVLEEGSAEAQDEHSSEAGVTAMTVKFVCQKCGKDTEVDMHYDKDIDSQVFECTECGARHVQVDEIKAPGAPIEIQFRLADES